MLFPGDLWSFLDNQLHKAAPLQSEINKKNLKMGPLNIILMSSVFYFHNYEVMC